MSRNSRSAGYSVWPGSERCPGRPTEPVDRPSFHTRPARFRERRARAGPLQGSPPTSRPRPRNHGPEEAGADLDSASRSASSCRSTRTALRSSMCIQRSATGIIGHSMRVSPTTHMMSPPTWRSVTYEGPQVRWVAKYAGKSSLWAPGQREAGEGVDRDGQEQVEELQGRVEAIGVGIAAEDLAPEQVSHDKKARCSALWMLSCSSVRLYQLVRWLTGMITA